jgi:hypothetical protein
MYAQIIIILFPSLSGSLYSSDYGIYENNEIIKLVKRRKEIELKKKEREILFNHIHKSRIDELL